MHNKEKYLQYAQAQPGLPLFLQPWWLEAAMAGDGEWNVVMCEKEGDIKAVLPYCYKKRLGITNIFIPWCTAYLAPFPMETPYTIELIEQLPTAADFRFRLFPGYDPEIWVNKGFSTKTTRTFLIENADTDEWKQTISSSTARQMRKAEGLVKVTQTDNIRVVYDLWQKNMQRKKATAALPPLHVITSIDKTLAERAQRQIWEARDENGDLHAAIYIAFDQNCAYYLFGGYDAKYKSSGATSLLFFHAISDAISHGKKFDFEGSVVESVANFYKGFGGIEVPVIAVHRTPSLAGKIWKRGA
jgi:uncharacterized membrane protein